MNLERGSQPYYRLIDHTADLGMEIDGADPAELFVNAGRALFDAMVSLKGAESRHMHRQAMTVEGYDWPDLMVNWLRELLYLWHGRRQIPVLIQIDSICETLLKADVTTCGYSSRQHSVKKEIKAATYHQIAVEPKADGGWRALVVFDV